ncbi:MAG: PAS domain-containing protein, partial [Rhodospirillaceae bacterium]|nr:PAS domain-containing protein [Rhodospirillaceae bacterium]
MRSSIVFDLARERPVLRPLALLVVVAVAILGVVAIDADIRSTRDRALNEWQIRLGLVAEERASSVRQWVAAQFGELAGIAENASAQIYLGAADASSDTSDPAALAERQYLENLLAITAERGGFLPQAPRSQVRANVSRPGVAGLALLNKAGRPIAATSDLPPLEGELATFLRDASAAGERTIWPMRPGPTGTAVMGFYQPMYAALGLAEGSERIGAVFGVKEAGPALFDLLRDPVPIIATGRSLLLRHEEDGNIRVLSPVDNTFGPLDLALSGESLTLAAVRAAARPGTFGEGRDIQGEPVLYTSRVIEATGWLLLYTAARSEALGPIEAAHTRRIVLLAAAVAGVCLLLVAAWFLGSSRRTGELAESLRESGRTVARQHDLLETLANTQPSAIALIDSDDRIAFANTAALDAEAIDQTDIQGKSAESLFGHAKARAMLRGAAEAREAGSAVTRMETADPGDKTGRTLRTDFLPIAGKDGPNPVLVVESDVTEITAEAARHEAQQRELVRFLVGLLDERDPHASRQSESATRIALAIADDMNLAAPDRSAIDLAGRLINLGKFFVPAELLRSEGRFDEEARAQIRAGHTEAAELLALVAVDPVMVEAFRDTNERWDGGGWPAGKSGDEISLAARVLAVANAAVAMA